MPKVGRGRITVGYLRNRIIERRSKMGRTRRIGMGVFIFAALVMGLVASIPNWTMAQPIKIGALLSMTGPFVDPGKDFRNAIELKLDESAGRSPVNP